VSSIGKLTSVQIQILKRLAAITPAWTLVGGAALSSVHLKHRTTRDLDLFWREQVDLAKMTREIQARLANGFHTEIVQKSSGFVRLRITDGVETVVVDLVVDLTKPSRSDSTIAVDGVSIRIADKHEVFVNKLCSLFGRAEIRDLQDIKALLESGEDLELGVLDAFQQDHGFSPLLLAWILQELDPVKLAKAAGLNAGEALELKTFKDELMEKLILLDQPDGPKGSHL